MKNGASLVVLIAAATLAVGGCHGRNETAQSGTAASGTIAPAAAQPEANGNEAMTQTVDVTDGRSEDEVATATNGPKRNAAKSGAATGSATTTAVKSSTKANPKPAPPVKKP